MFTSFGITEIILIFIVLIFLFGGKNIPQLAKGIGKGIKELKSSARAVKKRSKY